MIKTKTKIFPAKTYPMKDLIDATMEIFKELEMAIQKKEIDKSLVEIMGKGKPGSLIKRNKVTIYYEEEEDNVYVKLKSEMQNPDKYWERLENYFKGKTQTLDIEEKNLIVDLIIEEIKSQGYNISDEDAWSFLVKFEENYDRLPTDEEILKIGQSYIKMMESQGIKPRTAQDSSYNEVEISPTEALIEIVKEIDTLTDEDKNYFISLFDGLSFDEQKKLVTKIKLIESDLDKIPYLNMEDRAKIRKEVLGLRTDKRRERILKIIEKRKKNLNKYAHQALLDDLRSALSSLNLTELETDMYLNQMERMDIKEKKIFIKKIRWLEKAFNKLRNMGIEIPDFEKRTIRDELLFLGKEERDKRLNEIIEEHKYKKAEQELIEAIPSLKYENNKKLIKELMWLTDDERKEKIARISKNLQEETQKKSKVFESSKVGSTCPDCGWPIGLLSKKCPRCGRKLGFSLDI